jgi:hypothetical protein
VRRIRGKAPDATIQSDHEGIAALLNDLRADGSEPATQVYFRRGGFARGPMRAASAERDMPAARARLAAAVLSAVTDCDWQTVTNVHRF